MAGPGTNPPAHRRRLGISRYLLPIGLDDRIVVTKNKVESVRVVGDAADATRRDDPAQYLGQVLLTHDTRLPGCSLAAFGKLLADAVFAAIGGDARLLGTGELFDLDRVLRCPDADPPERVGLP